MSAEPESSKLSEKEGTKHITSGQYPFPEWVVIHQYLIHFRKLVDIHVYEMTK